MEEFVSEKRTDEHNVQSGQPEIIEEGVFSRKIISLFVGLLVVVLIISGGTYAFLKSRVNSFKSTVKTTVAQNTPSQSGFPQAPITALRGTKLYADPVFGYSIQIPSNMETFKRAGDSVAYQIGIRKIGEANAPIVVGVQQNMTGETLDQWVDSEYGANTPRARKMIGGVPALIVRQNQEQFVSYIIMNKSSVYEFSVSTVNPEYTTTLDQILASLTFSTR